MSQNKDQAIEYLIIPRSQERHGYNVESYKNGVFLDDKRLPFKMKELFVDKPPLEQLALYYLVNKAVIADDVRNEIKKLGLLSPDDFYDADVLFEDVPIIVRDFVQKLSNGDDLFRNYFPQGFNGNGYGNGKKMKKKRRVHWDMHHLIPSSSADEGFLVGDCSNLLEIPRPFHRNWHRVYANRHPKEILRRQFDIYENVLSSQVRRKVSKIIGLDNEDFYHPDVLA